MEAIFKVLAKDGKAIPYSPSDYEDYLIENDGEDILFTAKPLSKVAPKLRMYAYLFGPLAASAVRGYAYRGYEGIDNVGAMYKLQAEFAKKQLYNEKTKEVEYYLESLSSMKKDRLLKFLQDCIFYVENNLDQRVPDSQEYKMMQLTGHKFKSTKYDTNKNI